MTYRLRPISCSEQAEWESYQNVLSQFNNQTFSFLIKNKSTKVKFPYLAHLGAGYRGLVLVFVLVLVLVRS